MKRVVLGILTTYPDGTSCHRPRRPQWRPMAELIQTGESNDILAYVFSPDGVDWVGRRVRGFRFVKTPGGGPGRWRSGLFPLPDVVYNRVPTRIAEGRPGVQRVLRRFHRTLTGRVFNPHYLNKSRVSRILLSDDDMARHVPATMLFRDGSRLRPFLRRHKMAYIKSIGGSLGNDIMRVTAASDGQWVLHYNAGPSRTRVAQFGDWGSLLAHIRRLMRARPFVVQQGIRLAKVHGRPFDLRVLVQKLPDGRWHFTGGAARVAGAGQITTHVPRGGRRLAMAAALERAFGEEVAPVLAEETMSMATRAAAVLDDRLGRRFAEMSLDIGLDRDGHPWIFEMNAKPLHFDETDIQRRRNMHLLAYAKAAAENSNS